MPRLGLNALERAVELATGRSIKEIRETPLSETKVYKERRQRFDKKLDQELDRTLGGK